MGEEGLEDEVELLMVADAVDAGMAKTDGFAVTFGREGDFRRQGEGDADTGCADFLAKLRVGFEGDEDAGLAVFGHELQFGVVGVGEAGSLGISLDVVAAVCAAKELQLEGAFERFAANVEFDCDAPWQGGAQEGKGCEQPPGCCHRSIVPRAAGWESIGLDYPGANEDWERLQVGLKAIDSMDFMGQWGDWRGERKTRPDSFSLLLLLIENICKIKDWYDPQK